VRSFVDGVDHVHAGAGRVVARPVVRQKRLGQDNGAPMLQRQTRLHPGATAMCGLDDHRGRGIAAHDCVSHGEGLPGRRGIRPELAQNKSGLGDLLLQCTIRRRVTAIDAAADDRDGTAVRRERCPMSRGVDAGRQAGHHRDPVLGQRGCDAVGQRDAIVGGRPGTNHGNGQPIVGERATGEDDWRHLMDITQPRRIAVVENRVDADAAAAPELQEFAGLPHRCCEHGVRVGEQRRVSVKAAPKHPDGARVAQQVVGDLGPPRTRATQQRYQGQ
jgi:hypothetical protein